MRIFPPLELILWGGAAMPVECIEVLRKLGKRMLTAYGMTETACHVTYTDAGASLEELTNSVGKPDPHCEIRLEADDGSLAGVEQAGELQVRGEFLMLRYWQREEATRDTFTSGRLAQDGGPGRVAKRREPAPRRAPVGYVSSPVVTTYIRAKSRRSSKPTRPSPSLRSCLSPTHSTRRWARPACSFSAARAWTANDAITWCRERLANYKVPKSSHRIRCTALAAGRQGGQAGTEKPAPADQLTGLSPVTGCERQAARANPFRRPRIEDDNGGKFDIPGRTDAG